MHAHMTIYGYGALPSRHAEAKAIIVSPQHASVFSIVCRGLHHSSEWSTTLASCTWPAPDMTGAAAMASSAVLGGRSTRLSTCPVQEWESPGNCTFARPSSCMCTTVPTSLLQRLDFTREPSWMQLQCKTCQMGVRWVCNGCHMGIRCVPCSSSARPVRWVPDGYQMDVRCMSDGCKRGVRWM